MKHIQIVLLALIVLSLFTCSKDKDNDDEIIYSTNKDSVMNDLFTVVPHDSGSFMDIASIPIQQELYDYAEIDTGFKASIEAFKSFNTMLENPGVLLGTSSKSSLGVNWEPLGCEDYGNYSRECKWERDYGEYKYTSVHLIEFITGTSLLKTYIRGTYDGFNFDEYGNYEGDDEGYLISDWMITSNNQLTIINTYYVPFDDIVAGEPVFSYIYEVGESTTIYTPWGEDIIIHVILQNIIYGWDYIDGHHPSIHYLGEWEGDILTSVYNTWCLGEHGLRTTYTSVYDFEEHEGAWCTYECDGTPIYCSDK